MHSVTDRRTDGQQDDANSRSYCVAVRSAKNRSRNPASMLVHIVEFFTAVVEVDTKVTNASLTQKQCLQCVTPPLMHVEILRLRDATELNNDGMIKLGDVHYQTEPNLSFFPKEFSQRRLQFLFPYFFCN